MSSSNHNGRDPKSIFTPADFPQNGRVASISPSGGIRTREILCTVRPDVTFVDPHTYSPDADWLLVSGPHFETDIRAARERGWKQPAIILPEHFTSYYDFWTFPIDLIQWSDQSGLFVNSRDFEGFIAGLGDFFGGNADGRHQPRLSCYMPLRRMSCADPQNRVDQVIALLGDRASRDDFRAAVASEPRELWRHWLLGLYNGLEYMDYIVIEPGSVVMNCGVHGGGEIPYFLSSMVGRGTLINVDPLGYTYLAYFVRQALAGSSAKSYELPLALHDHVGSVDLPVDTGGMAAGGRIGEVLPGLETKRFGATTIDALAADLAVQRVDLIKMDIEGAEPRALAGAWNTIDRFRPQLAISIYHLPEHFVELPLILADRLKDYRFFLRNYHFISNETIFYAIPHERPVRPRQNRIRVSLLI
jgi:FkbM family methyltransferase